MTSAVRRAGQHAGRLSLLAFVVLLVVTGVGGIDALGDRMLTAGASRMLADAEPGARSVRVVAAQADDAAAQDAQIRDAIASAFSGSEVDVARRTTDDLAVITPADEEITLRVLDDERITELADLTSGSWPQGPGELALTEAAAQRLSIAIGDTLTLTHGGLEDASLTLVGFWSARDPLDTAWLGDPSVVSGESDGAFGPAVVLGGSLDVASASPTVTWQITPATFDLAAIPLLQRALTTLDALPDDVDPKRQDNTRVRGDLGETLQRQADAVAATRGLLTAPLMLMALLGVLVVGTVLTTLVAARREETVLLRSRGASVRRLGSSAAVETGLIAAAGAVVGLALVAGLGAITQAVGVTPAAWLTAGPAVVLASGVSGILTARVATGADVVRAEDLRSDAGARTCRTLLPPTLLVTGVGALATWQLFALGGVTGPGGAADPLATAAPALLLIAAGMLAAMAAGPMASIGEHALRRTAGIAPILPLRQLARRMGSTAVAILCLTLAASSAALVLAAPSAARAAEQQALLARLGGDVRMIAEEGLDVAAGDVATLPGVTGAHEVLRTSMTIGSDTALLVAALPEALGLDEPLPPNTAAAIPACITRTLAERLGATTGTTFTARIRSVARPATFEVACVVEGLPGVGAGLGVATDPTALSDAGAEVPPNELWLRSDTPHQTAAQLREQATDPVRILTASQVSAAPVASAAPMLLTAGALVTAALGLIGFFAASSAAARARRGEQIVLRALGLPTGRQRALRIGEHVAVAAYSVIVGAVLGAAVAELVLPTVLGMGS
ncbi:FtsX-like permease family protein [Microbacterium sp. Mu-80]|uniref:FtsX-like permease family protein n=1 Tax=Microbacterium bandirmense TaxID=3122050 RepID=A0ABU8L6E1_9MICO